MSEPIPNLNPDVITARNLAQQQIPWSGPIPLDSTDTPLVAALKRRYNYQQALNRFRFKLILNSFLAIIIFGAGVYTGTQVEKKIAPMRSNWEHLQKFMPNRGGN